MTDIIAKQTVILCRRMGWAESASPDLEVSPTRGGWAGGVLGIQSVSDTKLGCA